MVGERGRYVISWFGVCDVCGFECASGIGFEVTWGRCMSMYGR